MASDRNVAGTGCQKGAAKDCLGRWTENEVCKGALSIFWMEFLFFLKGFELESEPAGSR